MLCQNLTLAARFDAQNLVIVPSGDRRWNVRSILTALSVPSLLLKEPSIGSNESCNARCLLDQVLENDVDLHLVFLEFEEPAFGITVIHELLFIGKKLIKA